MISGTTFFYKFLLQILPGRVMQFLVFEVGDKNMHTIISYQ